VTGDKHNQRNIAQRTRHRLRSSAAGPAGGRL